VIAKKVFPIVGVCLFVVHSLVFVLRSFPLYRTDDFFPILMFYMLISLPIVAAVSGLFIGLSRWRILTKLLVCPVAAGIVVIAAYIFARHMLFSPYLFRFMLSCYQAVLITFVPALIGVLLGMGAQALLSRVRAGKGEVLS
jgi:hypothetical protein